MRAKLQYSIFTVNYAYIGIAYIGKLIYCNTIPFGSEEEAEEDLIRNCRRAWGRLTMIRKDESSLEEIAKAVNSIYNGMSCTFELSLAEHRNKKFQEALIAMSLIPKGRFTTYKELSKVLRTSPRAVGTYASKNPFPLLIPCHRVVRGDMRVGGYGYGTELKAMLLSKEGIEVDPIEMRVRPDKLIRAEELRELREVLSK